MSFVTTADGIQLYCGDQGSGPPIILVHEFSGTYRSFDDQVAAWKADLRCVTFNARGYPPSDVPASPDSYSQDIAAQDIAAILDGLGIETAHLLGVSMGSAAILQFAVHHPARVRSMVLASIGTGSDTAPDIFRANMEATAARIEAQGMENFAASMNDAPARRRLKDKNPAAFRRFVAELSHGSALGSANTMRGVQGRRRPIYAHGDALARLGVPALIVLGGDDADCRKPSEFLARTLPQARLEVFPETGHGVNLEEPAHFNHLCRAFVLAAETQRASGAAR